MRLNDCLQSCQGSRASSLDCFLYKHDKNYHANKHPNTTKPSLMSNSHRVHVLQLSLYLVVIKFLLAGHCINSATVFTKHQAVAPQAPHQVFLFIRLIQVAVHSPGCWLVGIVVYVRAYLACIGLHHTAAASDD